jgi:hypothetical protein
VPDRYVRIREGNVSLELAPTEWAVVLDAIEKTRSNIENGYSPSEKAALYRSVQKFQKAAEQLRRGNDIG